MERLSRFNIKVFLLIAVLLSGVSGLFAQQRDTIAIIDAGSSGSRLYVYCIENKNTLKKIYPQKTEEDSSKGIALSEVAVDKGSVKAYVNNMTSKYKVSNKVPLHILATAGMRKIAEKDADSIYSYMNDGETYNNYEIKSAMTISGRYEGLYAWIAANYQEGKIGFESSTSKKSLIKSDLEVPYGILEIGGVSMQIAYPVAKKDGSGSSKHKKSDIISRSEVGDIYSKSYLGGGVDSIFKKQGNVCQIKKDFPIIDSIKVNFLGLGKPIDIVLKCVDSLGTFDKYIESITAADTDKNYHPKSNAEYMKTLFNNRIPQNLTKSRDDISWTEGAAIDILINKQNPESFNYDLDNPN